MARNEIKPLIATVPDRVLRERMEMFQQAAADHGRELQLGEDVAIGYRFFIAETQEKAIEKARPYFEEGMKFGAPLGIMNMPPDQIAAIENRGRTRGVVLPTLEDAAAGHAWLCGPPELIVEHLKQVEQEYPGIERVNLGSAMGMPRGAAQGATVHVRRRGYACLYRELGATPAVRSPFDFPQDERTG